jgi:hypothetical protein
MTQTAPPVHRPPNQSRSSSAPVSPTSSQCSGITQKGKRCKNPVKLDTSPDANTERFCRHHKKPAVIYSRSDQSRSLSATVSPTSSQCSGITLKGKRCENPYPPSNGHNISHDLAALPLGEERNRHSMTQTAPPAHHSPNQSRLSSTPVSPTSSSGINLIQCNAITKTGRRERCKNKFKPGPDAGVEQFCHIHKTTPTSGLIQCSAITNTGRRERCKNKFKPGPDAGVEQFCHIHKTTPSSGRNRIRCSGITGKGNRCKRNVKTSLALSDTSSDAGVERFCFQHKNQTAIYALSDRVKFSGS